MNRPEWVFVKRYNGRILVHNCDKEPPQELITQMLLLNCHGVNYDKQNND